MFGQESDHDPGKALCSPVSQENLCLIFRQTMQQLPCGVAEVEVRLMGLDVMHEVSTI
jgi:hypothetical protein